MSKFRAVDCRRISKPSYDAMFDGSVHEGDFWWSWQSGNRCLWILMPYDRIQWSYHCLVVCPEGGDRPHGRPSWEWDGNEDAPTLKPSIQCGPKEGEYWHGYLTAGRLVPV